RTIPAHSMARTRLVELLEIRLFVPNEPIELYRFDGREIFWSRIDRIRSSDGIEIDAVFSRLPHAKHQVVGACGIVTGHERWFPRSVQSGQIELPTLPEVVVHAEAQGIDPVPVASASPGKRYRGRETVFRRSHVVVGEERVPASTPRMNGSEQLCGSF